MKKYFKLGFLINICLLILVGCSDSKPMKKEVKPEEKIIDFEKDIVCFELNDIKIKDQIIEYRKLEYEKGVDIWLPKEIAIEKMNYFTKKYKNASGLNANIVVEKIEKNNERIRLYIQAPTPQSIKLAYENYFDYELKDKLGGRIECYKTEFSVAEDLYTSHLDFYSKNIEDVKWLTIKPYNGRVESQANPSYFIK